MDQLAIQIQKTADAIVPYLVGTLVVTGLYMTFRLGFVQFFRFPEAIRETIKARQTGAEGPLSPLQAFMTSIAGTIGTGNIAGVATAIVSGGPGALFWIWIYGFFAMATKFSEAALGLHFRVADGEESLSGPMYYLRDGLRQPWLAWVFALIAGIACLLTTPFTQPNSVAVVLKSELVSHELGMKPWSVQTPFSETPLEVDLQLLTIGIVLAVLTWLVIVRGVKSIGRAAEMLSPLKVGFYLVGGLIVIAVNAGRLPEILALVVREAFSTRAALGTAAGIGIGRALRYGLARGAYANEAGYGTAAVAYGTAKSNRPEQQGLNAVVEVFIITYITSTISALTILLTDAWKIKDITGPAAVPIAFNSAMPGFGGWMVAFSVFLFGYTTLIGWAYYGEQFLEYLFGPRIIMPYRWLYCLLVPLGAIAKVDMVWAWGDMLNLMQVFPNVIGLIGLSGLAATYARTRMKD